MQRKLTKTRRLVRAAGHELKVNPPKILAHTARKFGAKRAEAQRRAILLAKARRAGARLTKREGA